jgi:hypothetical protein
MHSCSPNRRWSVPHRTDGCESGEAFASQSASSPNHMTVRTVRYGLILLALALACVIGLCQQAKAKPDAKNSFWVMWEQTVEVKYVGQIAFVTAQTGWAVGSGGTILATRDGGANWEAQRSGTNKWLADG